MPDYHTAYYAGYNIRFDVVANTAVDVEFCCEAMKMEEEKKREKIECELKGEEGAKRGEKGKDRQSVN